MAGEDVWGVVVRYVREDWLKFCLVAQLYAQRIRVEKFVQALGQMLPCHSPIEDSHCARLRESDTMNTEGQLPVIGQNHPAAVM